VKLGGIEYILGGIEYILLIKLGGIEYIFKICRRYICITPKNVLPLQSENYTIMAKFRDTESLQSYILTTAKYDFSVYEKRVLYKLVEIAQSQTKGLDFPKDCRKIDHDLFDFITIEIPYSSLLSPEERKEGDMDEKARNNNHSRVRAALRGLQTKIVEYEDKKTWESLSIIANPKYKKYSDKVSFIIDPRIWDVILNFSKGFRAIELKYTLWFSSVYTMRFYEILSRQTTLEHTFEELKEWFGLKDKYQGKDGFKDFRKNVIEPAQQELKDKAPFYFEYAPIKQKGSRKRNAFKFHVVHKPELQEQIGHTEAKMQVSVRNFISREEKMYLMENFGFTEDGLRANNELFEEYVKWFDLLGDVAIIKAKMSELERKGSTIGSPQGYLINSLKKKLEKVFKPSDRPISTDIEEPTPKGSNRKPTAKELKEAKEAIAELSARTGFDFSRPK
jgi:predicted HicB family RNase H-like nuclease